MNKGNCWPNGDQLLLLRAALLDKEEAQAAWGAYCERVDLQKAEPASLALLPFVYRNLQQNERIEFKICKGKYRYTWCANQVKLERLQPLFTQLLAAGVEKIVLLKGMAMILHWYRDFGVRMMADVDFLIAKEQLPIVNEILLKEGWKPNVARFDIRNPEALRRWHALNFTHPDGREVDVHWSLIQENARELDEIVLRDAQMFSNGLYVLNATDLLFQICVHGGKYSPVPLIRWIVDAATLLKNSEIDWDRMVEWTQKAHVSRPVSLALGFLKNTFEVPIPASVIQTLEGALLPRLEYREHWFYMHGYKEIGTWYRYCLNKGYLTLWNRLRHLPKYLQLSARLDSFWQVPFYAVYWPIKRIYRILKKLPILAAFSTELIGGQ